MTLPIWAVALPRSSSTRKRSPTPLAAANSSWRSPSALRSSRMICPIAVVSSWARHRFQAEIYPIGYFWPDPSRKANKFPVRDIAAHMLRLNQPISEVETSCCKSLCRRRRPLVPSRPWYLLVSSVEFYGHAANDPAAHRLYRPVRPLPRPGGAIGTRLGRQVSASSRPRGRCDDTVGSRRSHGSGPGEARERSARR